MNEKRSIWRMARVAAAAFTTSAALVACGGGGSDSAATNDPSAPAVTGASVSNAKYGQIALLTLQGTNLSAGLAASATGCQNVTRSATAPFISSDTTAYYQCTVSAVGTGNFMVTRTSDGATLATQAFTVATPQVTLTVSNGAAVGGTIVVTLAPDKTPITVNNFLGYVNSGFYNGTIFHRVSPGFVVQGGGYAAPIDATSPTPKSTNAAIALEVGKGLSNTQWTIAMARNSDPSSATSQFFINLVDNSASLDPGPLNGAGYAVFGAITGGTDAVTGVTAAPCSVIPFFLPSGECTPTPMSSSRRPFKPSSRRIAKPIIRLHIGSHLPMLAIGIRPAGLLVGRATGDGRLVDAPLLVRENEDLHGACPGWQERC